MTRTTRQAVGAMLPPGATINDLNDQQVAALFEAIIQQADGAGDGLSPEVSADGAPQRPGQG